MPCQSEGIYRRRLRNPHNYCIRLKIPAADCEDSWDLCRVAVFYGGTEVSNCYFAFANEEHWLTALEALRLQFGPEYFEPVESAGNHAARGRDGC